MGRLQPFIADIVSPEQVAAWRERAVELGEYIRQLLRGRVMGGVPAVPYDSRTAVRYEGSAMWATLDQAADRRWHDFQPTCATSTATDPQPSHHVGDRSRPRHYIIVAVQRCSASSPSRWSPVVTARWPERGRVTRMSCRGWLRWPFSRSGGRQIGKVTPVSSSERVHRCRWRSASWD